MSICEKFAKDETALRQQCDGQLRPYDAQLQLQQSVSLSCSAETWPCDLSVDEVRDKVREAVKSTVPGQVVDVGFFCD